MLLWRVKTRRLAILAGLMAGVAFLDLLEPGRGKFINPINQARTAIEAHQIARWIEANRVDPTDTRLLNCEASAPEPVAIDAAAADVRRALVGESEAFTLTAANGNSYQVHIQGQDWAGAVEHQLVHVDNITVAQPGAKSPSRATPTMP